MAAKADLKLKIPTSPESDGEFYMTPNTSVALEDDKIDSGLDDVAAGYLPAIPEAAFRITKNQSLGHIPKRRSLHSTTTTTNQHRRSNYFDADDDDDDDNDDGDSGLDEKYGSQRADTSFGAIYRMKSLGNLSECERSFGDTPKELLQLKAEFERRRFELTRRRSLTSLLVDDNVSGGGSLKQPAINNTTATSTTLTTIPKRESIFAVQQQRAINGKYKKKIGVGDTKYIGNDDASPVVVVTNNNSSNQPYYHLTKMKSLGMIPDLVAAERINYEPFLTPLAQRRHPVSLHDYRGGAVDENGKRPNSSSSSDDDDDTVFRKPAKPPAATVTVTIGSSRPTTTIPNQLRFDNEAAQLLNGPFERGFRRSYSRDPGRQPKPTTPLRQSDGYFQMPHFPVLRQLVAKVSQVADLKSRSSNHLPATNGKIDVIRYDSLQQ